MFLHVKTCVTQCEARGKPSTWLPRGGLVEQTKNLWPQGVRTCPSAPLPCLILFLLDHTRAAGVLPWSGILGRHQKLLGTKITSLEIQLGSSTSRNGGDASILSPARRAEVCSRFYKKSHGRSVTERRNCGKPMR